MVSSVDDLKSYSTLRPIQEEMKTIHLFVSFVTYMDLMLRGYSTSAFFLLHRVAVNILDQSPLAKCCNGSH